MDIREQFESENIHSIWERIRFWFLIRKIRRQKVNALWEAYMDKAFWELNHAEELSYVDDEDRKALVEERQRGDKADGQKIYEIEQRITMGKTVKQTYQKNEEFIQDIKTYINSLDQWINPSEPSDS